MDETVAVIPGTTTEKALRAALDKSFVNAKVVLVEDHAEGMSGLESGKVSAYASDRVILVGLLVESSSLEKFALAEEQFSYEPYGFMVRATTRTSASWPTARSHACTGRATC